MLARTRLEFAAADRDGQCDAVPFADLEVARNRSSDTTVRRQDPVASLVHPWSTMPSHGCYVMTYVFEARMSASRPAAAGQREER